MAKLKLTMPKPVLVLMGLRNRPLAMRMPPVIIKTPAAASVMAMTPGCLRDRNMQNFQVRGLTQFKSRRTDRNQVLPNQQAYAIFELKSSASLRHAS
jgi:hypothetical protein